jgi:hypothetical protein
MLDELLESYDKLLESEVRQPAISPEDRLRLIVKLCLDDIAGKRTTRLFTELWALANHNAFVADRVRAFYQRVHDYIGEVVTELNPALSPDQVHTLALYISASMEGTTPFLGHEKPWAAKMPQITVLAAEAMVALVKSVTPEQLSQVQ